MNMYQAYLHCNQRVFTDSRNPIPGALFVALQGERFDANAFVLDVLQQGAGMALTSREDLKNHPQCVWVADTTIALQDLAREHRQHLNIPVVGIAGSNGKTTTKELVTAVLQQRFRVHSTPGNFNNHIGLPLTILSTPPQTEILVLEMGSNHPGELQVLCEIGRPTSGLLTSLGKEHLEGFGSFEAVVEEEGALFDYLNVHQGTKFVLKDDALLAGRSGNDSNAFFYGTSEDCDVIGEFIAADPTVRFRWNFSLPPDPNDPEVISQLIGHYNFYNLLAAATVGKYYGVNFGMMEKALSGYSPSNNRSQYLEKEGVHLLLDAYNANPSSMELALDNFEKNIQSDLKIVVLGDMLELGPHEEAEHHSIVEKVKRMKFSEVWLVGPAMLKQQPNFGSNMFGFENVAALRSSKKLTDYTGGWMLFKGSRGIAVEKFLDEA
jgi:UDP-N-acetylmuramoyl-tripeptide--D-alanyl-D-alanine ligase